MKKTKKARCKKIILSWQYGACTVNHAHRKITGIGYGIVYRKPLVECSKATVRRALEELEKEGFFESFCHYGHCYDPRVWWRLQGDGDE
jgi:hypothetical protein